MLRWFDTYVKNAPRANPNATLLSWSEEEYLVLTDHRSSQVQFTDDFLEVLPMPTDIRPLFEGFRGFSSD